MIQFDAVAYEQPLPEAEEENEAGPSINPLEPSPLYKIVN